MSSNKSQAKSGRGRGGRGNNSNNNKQNKKGKSFPSSGTSSSKDDSIVAALKGFRFDCNEPGSADQAQKTLEQAIDYLGVTYSSEIRTELETRVKYVLNDPPFPAGDPGVIKAAEAKKKAQFLHMKVAWEAKIAEIEGDVDEEFFGSPRLRCEGVHSAPGQQERHPVGEEWKSFQFQANKAHFHSLFLRDQQDQERRVVRGVVSNRGHARGFLDKAHTGQAIHTRP